MVQNLENNSEENKKSTEQSPIVEVTRIFRAPLEWVWKAWSDSEIIRKWWGPMGYVSLYAKNDFRVGGKYLFDMESPDGKIIWSAGEYKEIIPNEKIVYTDQFADKDGNSISPNDIGLRGMWPKNLYVTVEFEKMEHNQTKMILSHMGIPREMHDEYVDGWNQSMDKFQEIVERYGDEHLNPVNTIQ